MPSKSGNTVQEKKMKDRLFKPDMNQTSSFNNKPYASGSIQKSREYQPQEFQGSKSAPVKNFSPKSFLGLNIFGTKDKGFSTKTAPVSNSQLGNEDQAYHSKSYDAQKDYARAGNTANTDNTFLTKSTSVPGATSKETLTQEGQALKKKVDSGDMTIEEVRELLNKPH
ncbi:MAG: hypothetical protein ABIP97_12430 [Chthoniobacterales bacterium]